MQQCEEAKANNRFPGLFSKGMVNGSLYRVRVRAGSGIWLEGWLRWSAHPLGGVLWRVHAQHPAFAPDSSEVEVGFLVFLYLVWFAPTAWACAELFLVPYSFFVFCCRGSQVPGSSLSHFLYLFFHLRVHFLTLLGGQPGNPLQYSSLKNPMGRRAWWTTVYRVAKNGTWLNWLSMHTHTHTHTYTTHILSLTQVTITYVPKLMCFHT